jgi:glycosyltransferase involved in cell wall biosynthesis
VKLTFPVLTLCKGGAQRVLAEIANRMTRRGHQVIVLMPEAGAIEYPVESEIRRLKRPHIIEEDYPTADVIVSNYFTTVAAAQAASERGKGKHVRYSLCFEPPVLPENSKSYSSYLETSRLIVVSQWQSDLMQLLYGINSLVVPPGVDDIFANRNGRVSKSHLTISAILRRPEGFALHRGQEYLIAELDRILSLRADVQVHYITPPFEYASSPTLQRMSGTGRYRFFAPADDVELAACYNLADVFVTPSTYESFCMPGLEAMRAGAALVAIYCGGNMDYCRPNTNCVLSYRHERRLGDDILLLLDDSAMRARIAAQGERDAREWTWERSADLFEAALHSLEGAAARI